MKAFLGLGKVWRAIWLLVLLLVVVSSPFERFKVVDSLENTSVALRFAVRGVVQPAEDDPRIVLLTIDDSSLFPELSKEEIDDDPWLEKFNQPWPWDRSLHGELLRRLLAAGARTVAFDLLFPNPGTGDLGFFEALVAAPGQVTLAFSYNPVKVGEEIHIRESLPYDDLLPEDEDQMLGFVNVEVDEDGRVREAVLKTDTALRAARHAGTREQRDRLQALSLRMDPQLAFAARAAEQFSPGVLDDPPRTREGRYPINYAGPSGWFESVRYIDLFLADRRPRVEPLLEDALVMIVPWSDTFKDIYPTPFGNVFGGEIHAHIARNVLLDNFLVPAGPQVSFLWLGGFALAVFFGVALPRSAWVKLASILILPLIGLALAQVAFSCGGYLLPLIPVLVLVVLGGGLVFLVDFVAEQLERKRIRSYLNRYVSKDVANLLLANQVGFENLNRGQARFVSLFFSDIRGFTGMSENRSPAELTEQLNEYFSEMVGAVLAHHGSLNKYIGDAIFAVWGDLHSRGPETDAANALDGALAMRSALARLNQAWQNQSDRVNLRIGMGLHAGNTFVGNLGHPDRLEVAVTGGAVNLASRIEGATKDYGLDILVSENFRELLPKRPFALVDRVRLAGVTQEMDLFFPVSLVSGAVPPWVEPWNRAVDAYRNQRFPAAAAMFEELSSAPDQLRKIYLDRCQAYSDNPPSSWTYTTDKTHK